MTTIEFTPNKAGRKKLAEVIAEHLGVKARYAGMPTFDYLIGEARLDRDWVLHLPDNADGDALLASKGALIAKALVIPATPMAIDEAEGTVEFAWFDQLPDAEVIEAVSVLIQLMIEHAKTATRVSAKPAKTGGNDKYAMRCWLLRLGMIGDNYKHVRRVLLANLEGNAAWKTLPKSDH